MSLFSDEQRITMTQKMKRTPTRAVRCLTDHDVPSDVAWALRDAAVEHDVPLARLTAVAEAESGFRNVWGHDPGKWREDGPLTVQSVRRYWAQPASRRPNGAGVMQLTYEPYQRAAEARGGLHDLWAQLSQGAVVVASLPGRGATAAGISRYNGSGTAAAAYGVRVHNREQVWAARLHAAGVAG